MYKRATATAWILLADLGTVLLTVSLSLSERTEGMLRWVKESTSTRVYERCKGGLVGDAALVLGVLTCEFRLIEGS